VPEQSLHARLAVARKDLLDLGGRNRLISTPRGVGRSSRLEIVDELSEEVFRRLVTEQKSMSFLPGSDNSPDLDMTSQHTSAFIAHSATASWGAGR
jgi:hypothetical protein